MHARKRLSPGQRRGVVLVLILGMLGLLALIGVTFASLSGQAQIGARNFALGAAFPQADEVFDFGLSQLINDTNNAASALRGHSLKRDMYGNDSVASNVNAAGNYGMEVNLYIDQLPYVGNVNLDYSPLAIQAGRVDLSTVSTAPRRVGLMQYRTNIPVGGDANRATYGLNFQDWFLKLPSTQVSASPPVVSPAQTFEVVFDDDSGSDSFSKDPNTGIFMHLLTVSTIDSTTSLNNPYNQTVDPTSTTIPPATLNPGGTNAYLNTLPAVGTYSPYFGPFSLDGRRLRAFNGPGVGALAYRGNFLFNGIGNAGGLGAVGDPNYAGMDEDYDAVDLENWFLALQSADGNVMIPSFHRPGLLRYEKNTTTGALLFDDWVNPGSTSFPVADSRSRILRRRATDMGPNFPKDPRPDPTTGKIEFDVDNDGDGVTDSVWLDLGYPIQRDPAGKLYKPMFAFMVLGLNGRLPLNTVGNLQGRHYHTAQYDGLGTDTQSPYPYPFAAGDPTYYHTSHLGMSPSEINPAYAFMHPDTSGGLALYQNTTPQVTKPYFAAYGAEELQSLLTGTRDGNGNPIAGRWGESEIIPPLASSTLTQPTPGVLNYGLGMLTNPVRAGRSYPVYGDGRDSDFDTYDFIPYHNPTAVSPNLQYSEQADSFDNAGANLLSSERARRFVTPQDSIGTGRLLDFDPEPLVSRPKNQAGLLDFGQGNDPFGRVGFFLYFRPAGLPQTLPWGISPTVPNRTSNLYHGFEHFRNPSSQGSGAGKLPAQFMASMPWYNPAANATPAVPTFLPPHTSPTFFPGSNSIPPNPHPIITPTPLPMVDFASGVYPSDQGPVPALPAPFVAYQNPGPFNAASAGTISVNEADQMDLYSPKPYDAPFGPHDLEWLYRKHDIDGTSLNSRLAALVPGSATNKAIPGFNTGNTLHSRLFSLESWENNTFVWANDNPGGYFPENSRFKPLAPASFAAMADGNFVYIPDPAKSVTPPAAHKGRKINLNMPLPPQVVNTNAATPIPAELEPVRQKWINNVYYTLKAILPPKSIDTPEELAALSQYVVNIVDFRDTDAVCTQFTNPDVLVAAGTATAPPVYYMSGTVPMGVTAVSIVQFGVEYPPVALNEVLAYRSRYAGTSGPANLDRMFVEFVNMLTEDAGGTGAMNLDLPNWHLSILPDDPTGRPDPVTGQMPTNPPTWDMTLDLKNSTSATQKFLSPLTAQGTTGAANYFYVLSNAPAPANSEKNPPTAECTDIPTTLFPGPGTGTGMPTMTVGNYYWLYLTRPADPRNASSPQVVVDAFRFPYMDGSTGLDFTKSPPTGAPTNDLYSVQRYQPYRGAHNVPKAPGTSLYSPPDAYGYSEQSYDSAPSPRAAFPPTTGYYGQYQGPMATSASTMPIYNSLGAKNSTADDNWDYLPFHDRDFSSVAELMLVPGCPPGLFTKQFVEDPPSYASFRRGSAGTATPPPLATDFSGSGSFRKYDVVTFPYLVDNFYYTADGTTYADETPPAMPPPYKNGPQIGFTTNAGWHKMFDFFEVPSSNIGAIGPVVAGENFDWFRQDRRPGQININLIIDEEVFLGLIDDPRLNYNVALAVDDNASTAAQKLFLPQVVTQIDTNGYPTFNAATNDLLDPTLVKNPNGRGFYSLPNRGAFNYANGNAYMKAAFSDFLKIRHGGTGWLFAYGSNPILTDAGPVPAPASVNASGYLTAFPSPTVAPSPERPFHSLSYPDINYTLMRPAALIPPVPNTYPPFGDDPAKTSPGQPATAGLPVGAPPTKTIPDPYNPPPATITVSNIVMDPGLKNPYLTDPKQTILPPAIPARRLLQLPDNAVVSSTDKNKTEVSNASEVGDIEVNQVYILGGGNLANPSIDLFNSGTTQNLLLGQNPPSNDTDATTDQRRHPYYRNELMSKMMNLSTVRTHQYAVWVTVGFFEVLKAGNPKNVAIDPTQVPDILGGEVGAGAGTNVRYRGFFLIDRSLSTGFNPYNPGDFRDVITYRRRIE